MLVGGTEAEDSGKEDSMVSGKGVWAVEPARGIASDDFMALFPAPDSLKSPFKAVALPVRSGFKISPSLTVRQG